MKTLKRDVIHVGVDSGTIVMSSDDNLEKAMDVYSNGQDLACWGATAIWDGERGGIKTPHGDGMHDVVLRVFKDREAYRDAQDKINPDLGHATLFWEFPKGTNKKGFTMHVGDCGKVCGYLEIPDYHGLSAAWVGDYVLEIHVIR